MAVPVLQENHRRTAVRNAHDRVREFVARMVLEGERMAGVERSAIAGPEEGAFPTANLFASHPGQGLCLFPILVVFRIFVEMAESVPVLSEGNPGATLPPRSPASTSVRAAGEGFASAGASVPK